MQKRIANLRTPLRCPTTHHTPPGVIPRQGSSGPGGIAFPLEEVSYGTRVYQYRIALPSVTREQVLLCIPLSRIVRRTTDLPEGF